MHKNLTATNLNKMLDWRSEIQSCSKYKINRIRFKDSKSWLFSKYQIYHLSKRFFQIVAVKTQNNFDDDDEQLFIQQKEIGILGFLIYFSKSDVYLLVQAKLEPGNVSLVQLAPTCQATASNLDRVHGGASPFFSKYFIHPDEGKILAKTLQSEQGTKFYQKRNCNMLVESQFKFRPANRYFKWIKTQVILDALLLDYVVNTDSRSVLVCSPWDKLLDRHPFTKNQDEFTLLLRASYLTKPRSTYLKKIYVELQSARKNVPKICKIAISSLKAWQIHDSEITKTNNGKFRIIQLNIQTQGREVETWDQPIIDSLNHESYSLFCCISDGVLKFIFEYKNEPGLKNKVELSASQFSKRIEMKAKLIASVNQSDEGGRFYQDSCQYNLLRLYDISKMEFINKRLLTVSEIKLLLDKGNMFTNEARSALSIILAWL